MNKFLNDKFNSIIILGPTAVGKTGLGVKIADSLNCGKIGSAVESHIISADSRQVYRGLDIGSGKDLCEFTLDKGTENERVIPYHLIDIVNVSEEYNVFRYQKDFYECFSELRAKNILPIIVGGTGMYIDAIVRGYKLGEVPTNISLREKLQGKSVEELAEILRSLKEKNGGELHNTTDTLEHHRLLRAIEIETARQNNSCQNNLPENAGGAQNDSAAQDNAFHNALAHGNVLAHGKDGENEISRPDIRPLILGTTFDRQIVRERVTIRLKERLEEGMIDEVQKIHDCGIEWERLERLGLEYKFVSLYLQGKISYDELFTQLNTAIHQFVKRQETWFRGMEKKGVKIHWLPKDESRFDAAIKFIEKEMFSNETFDCN